MGSTPIVTFRAVTMALLLAHHMRVAGASEELCSSMFPIELNSNGCAIHDTSRVGLVANLATRAAVSRDRARRTLHTRITVPWWAPPTLSGQKQARLWCELDQDSHSLLAR